MQKFSIIGDYIIFLNFVHTCSTGARPRPLSASYQHRPSFSLPAGAGVEALFASATAEGEEGNLAAAAMTRRTNLDLDQDVRRERKWEGERKIMIK